MPIRPEPVGENGRNSKRILAKQLVNRLTSIDDLERSANRAHVLLSRVDFQRLTDRVE